FKLFEAFLEIVWRQIKIAVQLDDEVPIVGLQLRKTLIEGPDDATARLPKSAVGKMQYMNPVKLRSTSIQNFSRFITRSVVDNDPLRRGHGLRHNRTNCLFDIFFLIARRRNDHILHARSAGSKFGSGVLRYLRSQDDHLVSSLEP